MSVRKAFGVLAFGAVLTIAGLLVAQQPQPGQVQPRQPAQPGQVQPGLQSGAPIRTAPAGQQAQWPVNDHFMASCMAIGMHAEIEMARFAIDRTENEDVKEFAKLLIDDHEADLKKLARWAPEAARDGFLNEDRAAVEGNQPRPAARQPQPQPAPGVVPAQPRPGFQQPQPGYAQAGPRPIDAIGLFREVAMECVSTGKQLLSEKEGQDFDKCFVASQYMMHQGIQDRLTVFQRYSSSELAQLFSDASMTVDEHTDHAKQLLDTWEGRSGTERTAGREKEEKRE